MITRRTMLKAGIGAALPALAAPRAWSGPPPNIVLILADDLGYGDVGTFGSPNIRTPRIDALAAEGLKLTCMYAEPFCGPARAAMMTGCYPIRVAEPGNTKSRHTVLHDREITLAEVLRPAGYTSAMIGKWGLGGHSNNRWKTELLPPSQGFDVHFGTPASNDWPEDIVLLRDGRMIEKAPDQAALPKRYADETIEFIRSSADKPFFVYFCPNMPHVALDASAEFRGGSPRGLYGDTIEELDFHVGRIVDEVARLGLADNTYVVFTSDNGPWIVKREDGGSAGPFRSGKASAWEGGFRVPCVIWAPGRIAPGRTSSEIMGLQDFFPTFAALANAAIPSDRVIDGLDSSGFINGDSERSPRNDFAYFLWTHLQAVRQGRWKLHLPRPRDPDWVAPLTPSDHVDPEDAAAIESPMLFDLMSDFGERYDLSREHPDIVANLLGFAESVRADMGDYDRLGRNVRLFDPLDKRPDAPMRVPY
ncbi:MAG: sulfatase [Gammaproteobacteria bacterium]|nr:sulfatase [Gammaproteobacteria bacterium]